MEKFDQEKENAPVELGADVLEKTGGGISTTFTLEDKELKTLNSSTEEICLSRPGGSFLRAITEA